MSVRQVSVHHWVATLKWKNITVHGEGRTEAEAIRHAEEALEAWANDCGE